MIQLYDLAIWLSDDHVPYCYLGSSERVQVVLILRIGTGCMTIISEAGQDVLCGL